MTSIEVFTPQETEQIISVTEVPRNNARDSERYRAEAQTPGLSVMERWAKNDTADYLAHLALQDKIAEYSGDKPATSR